MLQLTLSCLMVVLCCSLTTCLCGGNEDGCYNTNPNPSRLYGTKTAYDTIKPSENPGDESLPGCETIGFYFLGRHGSRYPEGDDVKNMETLLTTLQSHMIENSESVDLCQEDFDAISAWTSKIKEEDSGLLATTGRQELREIAQRYQQRFRSILDQSYSQELFKIRHTEHPKNRTRESALAFAEGLFENTDGLLLEYKPRDEDYELGFFANCQKYIETIVREPKVEEEKFKVGPEVTDMISNVSKKLGLQSNLTLGELTLLHDNCYYEHAIYRDSPWCAVFNREYFRVNSYLEDLKYYWQEGFGHEINQIMPCRLVSDVLDSLELMRTERKPVLVSRFAHNPTFHGFLAATGMYNDSVPLMANNYLDQSERLWNSSYISAFGVNYGLALYDCEDETLVTGFINEKPITIPNCPSELCPLDTLTSIWKPIVDNCDYEDICSYP